MPMIRKLLNRLSVACLLMLMAGNLADAALKYTVEKILPQLGQQGTTVEVVVYGHHLETAREVLFFQEGLRCVGFEPLEEVLDGRGQSQKVEPGQAVLMKIEIAPDCPPGEHLLRIRTADALSEMVAFWVTTLPVIEEEHPWADRDEKGEPVRNDSPEFAQEVPLNTAISGICPGSAPQDHDWYVIQAAKGQPITVELLASRLGTHHYGGLNDLAVSVHDDRGRQLASNDDNALHLQDAIVQFVPEKTGRFFIHVRQSMDYETTCRPYGMHVGTFPRPMVCFPLGAKAGETATIGLLGDIRGTLEEYVVVPTPGPYEASEIKIFTTDAKGHCSFWPNRIHASELPDVFETESTGAPQVIDRQLPVAINGVIASRGETDWYQFSAKKGGRFRVRTYAATLDSELDARVIIKPADGNPAEQYWDEDDSRWEPHDLTGHHYRHQTKLRLDPVFMFEPKTDGDWLIGISDTRREAGPRHVYRVEFEPHINSTFVTHETARSQTDLARDRVVLFPGHRVTRPLLVQKGFGSTYNEPLQLRAEGLPAGVTMEAPPFRQGDGNLPVTFIAEPGVKPTATLVDLIVEPVDPAARESFRGGFVMNTRPTDRRGGYAMCFRITRRLALAVVEGAAFDLAVDPPRTPLVHNGTLDLTVRVNREPGFEGAVYLEADWLPPGVDRQPPLVIKAGETEGTYRLTADKRAAVGDFPFTITGREKDGGDPRTGTGFHYVCSPAVPVTVGEPHLMVTLLRAAIERGQPGTITAEINQQKPFAGEAELRLGRLPFGVEQIEPIPRVTSRDTTASFHLKVTRDCLTGLYRDIYCEAFVRENGQTIREESGSGMLRVDPERN